MQLETFSQEFITYYLNEYLEDFENCFYSSYYLAAKKDTVAHDHFNHSKTIIEFSDYITSKGIRDKKRKFNFILAHVFNGLILNSLEHLKKMKLADFISQFPQNQCLQWKMEQNQQNESPLILLTCYEKWSFEKLEQLKIAFQMYCTTWLKLVKENEQLSKIDPIAVFEQIKQSDVFKKKTFEQSAHSLPVEIGNIFTITVTHILKQLKHDQPISQNIILNKLDYLKKLVSENKNLIAAIGDIHGYTASAETALTILNKLNIPAYFLGDYIDRGPSSIKTLDVLIEARMHNKNLHFILGNHEANLLEAVDKNKILELSYLLGKRHSFSEYLNSPEKLKIHYPFLKLLPIFIELEHIILLHGGIENPLHQKIDQYSQKELLWTYGVHKYWNGKKIIRAHEVHSEPLEEHNNIVLDTGLAFDGYLTLAIIENSSAPKIMKASVKITKSGFIEDIIFYN